MTGPDRRTTALAVRPKPRRRAIRLGLTERGRLRRQVRFLRKQRELQLRDLGGLIFDMYRFGSKRQELVREKLRLMFEADRELREFEAMLGGRRGALEVREPGVGGSCPRCLTLYSTDAHYCWRCGLALTEEAETDGVLDFEDLDAEEPVAEEPIAEEPIAEEPVVDEPADTVEADAVTPEASEDHDAPADTAESGPNGATDEQLTTEIEAGRLSSRSPDASRS